jgi:hypothetical protein
VPYSARVLRGLRDRLGRPIQFPDFALRLVLVVTAAATCALPTADSDTWWQLRAGRDIWHDHSVSLVDRYSYTAHGEYWPNHEWLWQLFSYGLHALGGMPLLGLVNGLLAFGAIVLAVPRRATRSHVVLLLLAIPLVVDVLSIRPQVTSLFAFSLLVWLLRREHWWAIPVLMLVWANLHGAVATGGVTLVAACGGAVVVHVRQRTPESFRRVLLLVVITLLSAAATLATPLGYRLWTYVADSIARSKSNSIQEWQSAFQWGVVPAWFWGWLALTAVAAVLARRRIGDWESTLLVAVVLVQAPFAIAAVRNFPFFALSALPLVCLLTRRDTSPRPADAVSAGRPVLLGAAVLGALAVAATYVAQPPRLAWQPMSDAAVAAIEACPGHVYTTYYSGGFLIWFTSDVPVFVDNRQDPYPPEILDLGKLHEGLDYQPTFDRYDVRCAAIDSTDASSLRTLQADGWTTSFDDGQWVVLRRP